MTTTTDIATRPAGVLAVTSDAQAFTDAQLEAFGIAKASRGEQMVFLHTVQRTGLDPAAKQIYMVGRYDKREQREKFTIQTGIDGYRLIADRTGLYAGSEESWEERNGRVFSSTVTVWKFVPAAGGLRPFQATAHWDEYVQTSFKDNTPMGLWGRMPHRMLAKCAEALALRKAFPQDLSGVYTAEEMAQADSGPAQAIPNPARAGRAEVVDVEVVEQPDPSVLAAGVTAAALSCGDADKIRATWRAARDKALLGVDVRAHVPADAAGLAGVEGDGTLTLGDWLAAVGKWVADNGGLSLADVIDASDEPDTKPVPETI